METTTVVKTAEAPVEAEASPNEIVFSRLPGNLQFSVSFPHHLHGKWVKEYLGTYSNKKYSFLTGYINKVEAALGLAPGASGIHNPEFYWKGTLQLEFHHPDGFAKLKEALAAQGITWNKASSTFNGNIKSYENVKQWVAK